MNYITEFRKVVRENPNKPAVVDLNATRTTTFLELDQLSDKVSGKLHALGCTKGNFIIILIERRMEFLAAYFGILKAGCVVVPLTFDYPKERIERIKNHCDAKLTIGIDFFEDIEKYEAFENLGADDDPALLVYTSGSTGEPKGIIHAVSSIMHTVNRYKVVNDGVEPLIRACPAPFSFIAHLMELLPTLIYAGCVHILDDSIRHSPELLREYIQTNNITCGAVNPKLIPLFNPPDCMQRIYTGGDYLYEAKIQGNYTINLLYGQSEAGGIVCRKIISKSCIRPTLGKPFEGIEILILDENGKEIPHGQTGEIGIKGAIKASYFKLPEETAKHFIKMEDGETLIRTGDVGYIDENGELVYINRSDWMVKINGYRVELLDVQHALTKCKGVKEAAIKDFANEKEEKFLVGYYVSDENLKDEDIRIQLNKSLPAYMIPRYLVRIPAIPKNINGKIDRKALLLPKFDEQHSVDGNAIILPETDIQKTIYEITKEIIGQQGFGIRTNLYQAGLSSIGVVNLIEKLSQKFNVVIRIKDIEENNTIEGIEKFILANNQVEEYKVLADYPLTIPQLAILGNYMQNPDSLLLNVTELIKIKREVDVERLKKAIVKVIHAHPYLETRLFATESREVRQKRMDVTFSESDIDVFMVDSIDEIKSQLFQPFNIFGERLFRIKIIVADYTYLFIDMHHIITDASSMAILHQDIESAYINGDVPQVAYSGYEFALQKAMDYRSPEITTAKSYFSNLFAGLDPSYLLPKTEITVEEAVNYTSKTEIISIYHDVEKYVKKINASTFAFFSAAFGYALSKYIGNDHSSFVSFYNGRNDSRFVRTIALVTQVFAIICDLKDISVSDYISSLNDQIHDNQLYCGYSFTDPLPGFEYLNTDVMFNYFGSEYNLSSYCEKIPLPKNEIQNLSIFYIVTVEDNDVHVNFGWDNVHTSKKIAETLFASFKKVLYEFLEKENLSDVVLPEMKA